MPAGARAQSICSTPTSDAVLTTSKAAQSPRDSTVASIERVVYRVDDNGREHLCNASPCADDRAERGKPLSNSREPFMNDEAFPQLKGGLREF